MPPDLVVATAAYTQYPGGIIALRCSDWMAGARGTLSSEADARSASGVVVRDSQTVTNSIFSAATAAFQEADDTLVVDFSTLPLEVDLTYAVFVSYLIEGDWDTTNSDTYRGANQAIFNDACTLGWYGDSAFFPDDTDRAHLTNPVRMRPSYTIGTFPGQVHVSDVVGNEVLYWRAYAQSGTTIEWLIDQIILVPYVLAGTHNGWRIDDFAVVAGSYGDYGSQLVEDGADGGDANGQFTWHGYPEHEEVDWSGADGGGDFQQKTAYADAEYMIHIVVDDGLYIVNTEPVPDEEAPARAYSVHGVRYREAQTFTTDDFSRTVGSDQWGQTDDGFGYTMHIGTGGAAGVNGTVGVHTLAGPANSASVGSYLSGSATTAEIAAANMTFSGEVLITGMTIGADPDRLARLKIGFTRPSDTPSPDPLWFIYIDFLAQTWTLARAGNTSFSSPVDISGWLAQDSPIGFKIEIKRYLCRAKVWDATGAEPGAWDAEEFRPLFSGLPSGTWYDYPYALAPSLLHAVAGARLCPGVVSDNRDIGSSWESHWDDFVVEYDPYGTAADMSAAIEFPHEGTKIGEIVVPYGSDYFVYWGTRDWTTLDAFSDPYLDFSGLVWNDTTAAELQRAEAPFWYFRSSREFIIPMNWRSSTREGGWKRILRGYDPD